MKLNQFIANLLTIVENNPELAEIDVVHQSNNKSIYSIVKDSPQLIHLGSKGYSQQIRLNIPVEQANAIIIN